MHSFGEANNRVLSEWAVKTTLQVLPLREGGWGIQFHRGQISSHCHIPGRSWWVERSQWIVIFPFHPKFYVWAFNTTL
jgi:hypothetical protein